VGQPEGAAAEPQKVTRIAQGAKGREQKRACGSRVRLGSGVRAPGKSSFASALAAYASRGNGRELSLSVKPQEPYARMPKLPSPLREWGGEEGSRGGGGGSHFGLEVARGQLFQQRTLDFTSESTSCHRLSSSRSHEVCIVALYVPGGVVGPSDALRGTVIRRPCSAPSAAATGAWLCAAGNYQQQGRDHVPHRMHLHGAK
jgi:hypothetical protein